MDQMLRTCALVAASDFNAGDFRTRDSNGLFDCVIAVDGGYAHLHELGVAPDLTIGDFDSLGYVPEGGNVSAFPAHKDKSDLELALDLVEKRGFERAIIYGALGGRLDHTIANLQMCARFAECGLAMELVDVDCAVNILVGPATLSLPALEKGTVSVFSAVGESHGVTERGLEYPLENAALTNRTTLGLSNEFVGKPASIGLEDGTLFVFHPIA